MDTINIPIEQSFYGHDGMMYTTLKTTCDKFTVEVERLCQSIGTPDGRPFSPFLLSRPIGDNLFMACCQTGEKDRSGRTTLFFHVIIVDREDARIAGINAYRLFNEDFFVSSLPGTIESNELCLSVHSDNDSANTIQWDGTPLIIQSDKPETLLIYSRLCDKINDVYWTSYSFRVIPEADMYVLSDRVPLPNDRTCIDVLGNVLPTGSVKKNCNDQNPVTIEDNDQNPVTTEDNNSSVPKRSMKDIILRTTSLIINFVLILVVVVLWQFSGSPVQSTNSPEKLRQQWKEELTPEIRQDFLVELQSQFEGERFSNLEDWKEQCHTGENHKAIFESANEREFAQKINRYIEFFHKNILNEKKNEKGSN